MKRRLSSNESKRCVSRPTTIRLSPEDHEKEMPMRRTHYLALGLAITMLSGAQAFGASCTGRGIEVQVLGSGGPEIEDRRASTGYLIWQDGKARVLIDAGSGTANHFGDVNAKLEDLDVIFLTHLHVDHSADLPVLVKSSFFGDRTRPLPVLGPRGNDLYPPTTAFVKLLFDGERGAYRYLGEFLPGGGGSYALQPQDLTLADDRITPIFGKEGMTVYALASGHGPVPSMALRFEMGDVVLAFSGDTNGSSKAFVNLAGNADLFIAHNAVPEGAGGIARDLHMPPSVIGRISAGAQVKKLVLSHRMLRTLGREAETSRLIAQQYKGAVLFANDLDCYPVAKAASAP
jgi:ribonuclease BN (tRNA processing enzyme)